MHHFIDVLIFIIFYLILVSQLVFSLNDGRSNNARFGASLLLLCLLTFSISFALSLSLQLAPQSLVWRLQTETMQYLKWLAKCLVLRTVPASLLQQEEARIRPGEFNLETVPLQPALHSLPARPHQMYVRAVSFKNCTKGAFILLGAAMLGVLITLVNVLVASWPGARTVSSSTLLLKAGGRDGPCHHRAS